MAGLLVTLVVAGLTTGSFNALVAVSFAVIYNTTKTFHIAHGATFLLAGYLSFALTEAGLPFFAVIPLVFLLSALFGALLDIGVYRPLRAVDAAHTTLLLASLGVLIVAEGVAGLFFGTDSKNFENYPVENVVGPLSMSNADIGMLVCSLFVIGLALGLARSRTGRMLRAVGDAPEMAAALGIPVRRMFTLGFLVGSAAVVPAAMAYVWQQGITPSVGLNAILTGAAAVILVNSGRVAAAALVALGLTVVQSLLVAVVPTGWSASGTFILLLIAVVARSDTFRKRRFAW
jgi:branched-chain amino acid transport system permease protein